MEQGWVLFYAAFTRIINVPTVVLRLIALPFAVSLAGHLLLRPWHLTGPLEPAVAGCAVFAVIGTLALHLPL